MNRFILLLIALLSWPLLGVAQSARVADLYARGLAGDKEAVSECIRVLEETLVTKPDDQLARVYLGSAYTLRARDRSFGKSKLDALHKGVALMDEAAAAAPKNANVLLTRAVTNEALPVFLGRRKTARTQLEELVALVEKNPAALKSADQQLLYLNAGQAAQEAGDKKRAREMWERGLTMKADPKLQAETKAALDQL